MRKIYMAREVSLILICLVSKTNWASYHMLNGIILLKGLISPLSFLLGVPNVKTTYTKSKPETLFQLLTFTFNPFINVKWGYLTTKALYLL